MRTGFFETLVSAPDARAAFSESLGFAADRRAYFLLLRQKKVAKEKATPGAAPGVARFLALLGGPGGLPELACGSDKASRPPPAFLRCSAPSTGTRRASQFCGSLPKRGFDGQPEILPKTEIFSASAGWPGPLARCRATQALAGEAGTDPGVTFSLATFFWANKRKYARRSTAKTSVSAKTNARRSTAKPSVSKTQPPLFAQ
ncbi:MAG: hypothetical protein H6R14_3085 [Proteobacteria bacterium]|nr:hypothetical protein [Pseudomonadota bacterium]